MAQVPNTVRRNGTYQFRRVIPLHLRSRFHRRELLLSLRTSDPVTARNRSRAAYLISEELFNLVHQNSGALSDDDIAALVREFYASVLQNDDLARLSSTAPLSDVQRELRLADCRTLAENSRRDLANNAFGSVQLIAQALLGKRFGTDVEIPALERRRAMQALLRAGIDVSNALAARYEGNFNYVPEDRLLRDVLTPWDRPASQSARSTAQSEAPAAHQPTETNNSPLFSVFSAEFRAKQERQKVWDGQFSNQARGTFARYIEVSGDLPMHQYGAAHAKAFKDALEDLPRDYGHAKRYRDLTALQIIELTRDDRDLARLAPGTRNRHRVVLAAVWDDALASGYVAANPFRGWKVRASKRAKDQRQMWNAQQLVALFNTPVWTGCQSVHRRAKPGALIVRDEKFWLPIIAVYSAMRQEEICQLRLTDVREEEGTWVFDVNATGERQLKNVNAIRLVPVHQELIALGLLRYAEDMRRAGSEMLFPELRPGGADERLGHNYSKWFARYRQDVGLYEPGLDFHSFRHSATTLMKRAGIDEPMIDELTGHATISETARYTKGHSIAQLAAAVNSISIGVDLEWLKPESVLLETAP